jgi:hypothetical protein
MLQYRAVMCNSRRERTCQNTGQISLGKGRENPTNYGCKYKDLPSCPSKAVDPTNFDVYICVCMWNRNCKVEKLCWMADEKETLLQIWHVTPVGEVNTGRWILDIATQCKNVQSSWEFLIPGNSQEFDNFCCIAKKSWEFLRMPAEIVVRNP